MAHRFNPVPAAVSFALALGLVAVGLHTGKLNALELDALQASSGRQFTSADVQFVGQPGASARSPQARVSPDVLISGLFPDGYLPGGADEAVEILNRGTAAVDVSGWRITDGEGQAGFIAGTSLPPGTRWWIGADPVGFRASFGRRPDFTWRAGSMTTVGGGPRLADTGEEVRLLDATGQVIDAVVYGAAGAPSAPGLWIGPPLQPYRSRGLRGSFGLLDRKGVIRESAREVTDTNTVTDWRSDLEDPAFGRRVRHPGWAYTPERPFDDARDVTLALAPEAAEGLFLDFAVSARKRLDVLTYTWDQPRVARAVAAAARRGVRVRVLLDGSPAGGFGLDQRWAAATLADAGVKVYWHDHAGPVPKRYAAAHAKLWVADGARVLIATENPSRGSMPLDDNPEDGTAGRRGMAVVLTSPELAEWASDLMAVDLDPSQGDRRPYQPGDPKRGAPPADYSPPEAEVLAGYMPRAPAQIAVSGPLRGRIYAAPELDAADRSGLLALLARAGDGARVRAWQLREPVWWGNREEAGSQGARNPRLDALIRAARRGADVQLLMDGHFDAPAGWNANRRTANVVHSVARHEGLALAARTGDPTGAGIHAKTVLVDLGPTGAWLHLGSLNGSEAASKVNREVAIHLESRRLHDFLAAVYDADWETADHDVVFIPLAFHPARSVE